jgi:hypothetical protein
MPWSKEYAPPNSTGESQPSAPMFGQSLRQELLVDRHLASLKQFDLLPVVVDTHHLVFKFGKTSGLPRALYTQNLSAASTRSGERGGSCGKRGICNPNFPIVRLLRMPPGEARFTFGAPARAESAAYVKLWLRFRMACNLGVQKLDLIPNESPPPCVG